VGICQSPGRAEAPDDSGFKYQERELRQAIDGLSSAPLTQLINTHWHVDSHRGNEWGASAAGATYSGREYEKASFRTQIALKAGAYLSPATAGPFLHRGLMTNTMCITNDPGMIALKYYGPGPHGIAISPCLFEKAMKLSRRRQWWTAFTVIDYSTGGRIDGMIVKPRG